MRYYSILNLLIAKIFLRYRRKEMNYMEYWERIRALREDKDITQKNLADHFHIAQNTYSQYENGKREIPISVLIKLCQYFEVSSDYILGLSDKKKR